MSVKEQIDYREISTKLALFGYDNIGRAQVVEEGQFSFRGGLLDLWLERYKVPVRLDLIGNHLEGIYLFNPLTQEKVRDLREMIIIPFKSLPDLDKVWKKSQGGEREKLFLSEIKEGDYVVHIDNGIGRFLGFETRNVGSEKRESLVVEYARGDKLFVPVTQIERLTKYIGGTGKKPQLSSLGTAGWERAKQKVKDSVILTAKELLQIYARRELAKRPAYPEDDSWQRQLEESFEFKETPDQLAAVEDIKKDLSDTTPMDRLLVGDVGFGKTEVALRAGFKVAQNGRQVALLVPTTILAEQHFHLFKERLKSLPVRVEILSRIVEKDRQKEIISHVENGQVDIIIGTHRLLSKDIVFKNLGLLIIDEEHRFGVGQKEQLKKIRAEVDVLSLSATPIPRTLQMSLTKIRDVSLLTTAPFGRSPIQMEVGEFSWGKAAELLKIEIERGGQAFFLSNKIATISAKTAKLRELLPGVKIEYGHGRMDDLELERVMNRFYEDEIKVLVCTTIIGSGLDVPNVNTIIIENSQKFGLADLYQLRGRVGRGEREAFAYLSYPKGYKPEGAAAQRLLAISQAKELGSGMKLASQDLEIRGAGNLLGAEQSGNITLVGFELYIQL
ncbi:MAG TPA: DEAD/DEAH box helicase, partial [Candidatus Saccharimonadales bacterium]|nr:DEAD/DEAH box helicase [Candidatus Saccharimonadales bacterium]